jgi:type II secretory pathway pseudopilin PulG
MTLAELLIVISILAITTMVAVQATTPLANQASAQATQQQLTAVQSAIIGTSTSSDGTVSPTGFLADTGGFPIQSDFFYATGIAAPPRGLSPYASWPLDFENLVAGGANNDVLMPSGWNGPYFQLSAGQQQLVDGWNRPLVFPTTFVAGETYSVVSLGADGIFGTADDMALNLTPAQYLATSLSISLMEQVNGSGSTSSYLRNATLQSGEQSFWLVCFSVGSATGVPAVSATIGPLVPGSGGAVQTVLPSSLLFAGRMAVRAFASSSSSKATAFDKTKILRSTQPAVIALTPRSTITRTLMFP